MSSKIISCVCAVTFTLVVVCGSSFAGSFPTDKGSAMVAGGFVFSSAGGNLYEEDGDRSTLIQFNPAINYFVTPGFAVGGKLLFARMSLGDESSTIWGIGPAVMYFFGGNAPKPTVKGTTYPYLGASFAYIHSTEDYGDEDFSLSGTTIAFGGGIVHMLSKTVGLFGELNYQIDNLKPEEGDSESGDKFNIGAGFTFFLY